MSALEAVVEGARRPLHVILFWTGIGLAPIAALLLLLAQDGGPLRIAAVLAVLAVVLIGLSITLRGDADSIRLDMEEALLEEIDTLREDLRNDIATAARATHRAFGEKLQVVQDDVNALRSQIEAGRIGAEPSRASAPGGNQRPAPEPAGFEPDGPPAGYAPTEPDERWAGQPGPMPAGDPYGGMGRHVGDGEPSAVGGRASVPPAGAIPRPRQPVSGALVRHTETVHVTTRHTIVNAPAEPSAAGRVYGGGGVYGGGQPAGGVYGGPEAYGPPGRWSGPADPDPGAEWPGGDGGAAPYPDGPGPEEPWSARGGERWATYRGDERGQELRMGERRAAVQADASGTEARVEDRWATVRRPGPGRDENWRGESGRDEGWRGESGRDEGWRGESGRDEGWRAEPRRDEGRHADRAWSAGGPDPSWSDGGPDRWRDDAGRSDDWRGDAGWREDAGRADDWRDQRWEPRDAGPGQDGPAALPPGGLSQSEFWGSGWAESPEREAVRRGPRYRDDDEEGYGYRADGESWGARGRAGRRGYPDDRW